MHFACKILRPPRRQEIQIARGRCGIKRAPFGHRDRLALACIVDRRGRFRGGVQTRRRSQLIDVGPGRDERRAGHQPHRRRRGRLCRLYRGRLFTHCGGGSDCFNLQIVHVRRRSGGAWRVRGNAMLIGAIDRQHRRRRVGGRHHWLQSRTGRGDVGTSRGDGGFDPRRPNALICRYRRVGCAPLDDLGRHRRARRGREGSECRRCTPIRRRQRLIHPTGL